MLPRGAQGSHGGHSTLNTWSQVRKVWNLKRSPKVLRRNLPSRGQVTRTPLVVQWLKLHSPNAGDTGSIPGQGTKIPHATWCGVKKEKMMEGNSCHLQVFSPLPCSSLQRWRRCRESIQPSCSRRKETWDITDGSLINNPPSNSGDSGSILGRGTVIPHTLCWRSPKHCKADSAQPKKKGQQTCLFLGLTLYSVCWTESSKTVHPPGPSVRAYLEMGSLQMQLNSDERWGYPRLGWTLNPTGVLIKQGGEAHKEGGCGKIEFTPGSDRKTKKKKKEKHTLKKWKGFQCCHWLEGMWSLKPKVIVQHCSSCPSLGGADMHF